MTADAIYTAQWTYRDGGGGGGGTVPPSRTGNLQISKNVTGDAGSTDEGFTFQVALDAGGSYPYSGSKSGTIKSGEQIMLQHGQSITIRNIPADTGYYVAEVEANQDGYVTTATGDSGNILAGVTASAAFSNHKSAVTDPSSPEPTTLDPTMPILRTMDPIDSDMPKTGDTFNGFAWLGLLLISGLGLVVAITMRRRRNGDVEQ